MNVRNTSAKTAPLVLTESMSMNVSAESHFMAIIVTIWVVLLPKTKIAWIVFKGLPEPPEELKASLNYK